MQNLNPSSNEALQKLRISIFEDSHNGWNISDWGENF